VDVVADASVIIAAITNEREKPRLIALTRGRDLIAPWSVHWEIGNAFSAMLRQKRVSQDEALSALQIYATMPIRLVDVELQESFKIAADTGLYAYDAYLIRCAEKYSAPLLSLDKGLLRAARSRGTSVIEVGP
jgi:predicted nucleic acid-binding protein